MYKYIIFFYVVMAPKLIFRINDSFFPMVLLSLNPSAFLSNFNIFSRDSINLRKHLNKSWIGIESLLIHMAWLAARALFKRRFWFAVGVLLKNSWFIMRPFLKRRSWLLFESLLENFWFAAEALLKHRSWFAVESFFKSIKTSKKGELYV